MPAIDGDDNPNVLEDTSGNDTINAMGGNDTITVKNGGIDTADGGTGYDTLVLDFTNRGPITMTKPVAAGGPGDRAGEVYENLLQILTYTHMERIFVTGSAGSDTLYGFDEYPPSPALEGDDVLDGGAGADIMRGGTGSDTYYVDNAGDVVEDSFSRTNRDTVYVSLTSYTVPNLIDEVYFTTNANITVSGKANVHTGSGNDMLIATGQGSDLLTDGRYYGGAGDDIYVRALAIENAGQGHDIVFAESMSLPSMSAIEVLTTTDQNSTRANNLTGNELDQWIYGGAGADVLRDGGGRDILIGRGGNDIYVIDSFTSLIFEDAGQGRDSAMINILEYVLNEGAEIEVFASNFQTSTMAQNLWGNSYDNEITGTQGANVLTGGGGSDKLFGLGGNDVYYVDLSTDQVIEENFKGFDTVYVTGPSYTLAAGVSVEVLSVSNHGFTTAIDLTGNELDNNVYGNAGSNTLDGGAGSDTMIGFGGADIFSFSTAIGGRNVDSVVDFAHGTDTIRLASSVFTGLSAGALSADAFNTGAAASDASDRILYDSATGALAFDADGAGGAAATVFAYLSTGLTISSTDFIVA